MKTIKIMILAIAAVLSTQGSILAQDHEQNNLAYVADVDYKVANLENSFAVEWLGEPAKPEQIKRIDDREVHILNPAGEVRLIVYLYPDGTFSAVVDLKYTDPTTYFARQARDEKYRERDKKRAKAHQARANEYDWTAYREFTFENGLVIMIIDEKATAVYNGDKLEVTGDRGRYRVITDDFEAGVAFGPEYDHEGYQYLREQ